MVGCVTYGPTPTPAVQQNICGEEWSARVLELNRLVISTKTKNAASFLVGRSLKMLPKPRIIVSYADGGMGHIGYVYQATNFLYTGAVTAHDGEYMIDGKKTHARTLTAKGISNPKEWAMKNGVEFVAPKPKHRYVTFVGDKEQRQQMKQALRYPIIEEYPKGNTTRYDSDTDFEKQGMLFS